MQLLEGINPCCVPPPFYGGKGGTDRNGRKGGKYCLGLHGRDLGLF